MLFLAAWHLAASGSTRPPFPTPGQLLIAIIEYWPTKEFLLSLWASLRRVAMGFLVGSALGIPMGILVGMVPLLNRLFQLTTEFFRPLSPIAWVPLAIIWFGLNEKATLFIIAYAVFFPVLLHTGSGVRGVERVYSEAALTLGASRMAIAREVMLPAALPQIMTGLRISAGLSWAVIVAAELAVAASLQSGIGYSMMYNSMVIFDLDKILTLVVAVGVVGVLLDVLLRYVQHRLGPWRIEVRSK
jgi:NitT/TauT family transport system permease protein